MDRFQGSPAAAAALALSTLLAASTATAETDRPSAPAGGDALGSHQRHVRLEAGVRTQYVSSRALDPFSTNDAITHVSLGPALTLWASDELSLAASLLWDYGSKGDTARNSETSLALHRFALGPEVRYHVLRIAAVTLRAAPTLLHVQAELADGAAGPLTQDAFRFGFDATAGAAVELYGYASGASRKPRIWLVAEGGYGFSAPLDLVLQPDSAETAPIRLVPVDLGELAISGPLFRVAAAVSFW
jgi:hypothetical protein